MVYADLFLAENPQALLFVQLFSWLGCFVFGLIGLFFSLYIIVSHEDMDTKLLQPAQLSEILENVSTLTLSLIFCAVAPP